MERTCKKCEHVFLSSELIGGMFCFPCTKKAMNGMRRFSNVLRIFGSFYQYTPIIAITISLIMILLDVSWMISILSLIMTFICLLGAFPHMHGNMKLEIVEEVEQNYKIQLNNYTSGKVSYCVNHPTREAITRCGICIEPFCAECVYFQRIRIPRGCYHSITYEQPAYCLKCGDIFKENIKMFPIIYTVLTIGALIIISYFTAEGGMFSIFIVFPFFICTISLPLGFLYLKNKLYRKSPQLDYSDEF